MNHDDVASTTVCAFLPCFQCSIPGCHKMDMFPLEARERALGVPCRSTLCKYLTIAEKSFYTSCHLNFVNLFSCYLWMTEMMVLWGD